MGDPLVRPVAVDRDSGTNAELTYSIQVYTYVPYTVVMGLPLCWHSNGHGCHSFGYSCHSYGHSCHRYGRRVAIVTIMFHSMVIVAISMVVVVIVTAIQL